MSSSAARNCKSLGYLCRTIGRCSERAGRKTLLTATSLLFLDVFPSSGGVHAFSVGGWISVAPRQGSFSWRTTTTTTTSVTRGPPDSRLLATTRAEDEAANGNNAASKMNPISKNLTSSLTDDEEDEKRWPTKGGGSAMNQQQQQLPLVVNGDTRKSSTTEIDSNVTNTTLEFGLGQQQQQQIDVNGDFAQQQPPPPPPSAPHQVNTTEVSNLGGGGGGGGGRPLDILDAQTAATASSSILAIDPKIIDIVPVDSSTTSASSTSTKTKTPSFVKMFRGSANYIANHRNTLAVYHIPGELLEWDGFPKLMDDIALTWLLGMKIVLVMGCRHQIDVRLNRDHNEHMKKSEVHRSIRVTDMETLRVVKEEAGYVRFEAERHLARALRSRVSNTKNELDGNVVSGNFYSAQPFGVIDGIDYQYTGFPRRVEIEKIRQVHDSNDIVLLTTLGVSPSGEVFNVNSESLAATVAGALDASKVIYFTIQGTAFRNRVSNKIVQNLRISDAKKLLEHYHVRMHNKGFASIVPTTSSSTTHTPGEEIEETRTKYTPAVIETLLKVGWAMSALERGVKRAHIIAPTNGALLQELYTRDGSGTLISGDLYEGIRRADVNDVAGIYDLISPLVQAGTLVERPKNVMEKDILSYYVYTRDNLIVATGQLKRFEGKYAEIGCLVVSKEYRSQGRGDAMLGYLERLCLQSGATKVFVLSTQTMEWFVERGFREVDVRELPPSRREVYNHDRRSKIYMKQIDGDRDLDASELWWNR